MFQVPLFNPFQNFLAACVMVSSFTANALKKEPTKEPQRRRFEDGGDCQGERVQAGDDSPADK